MSMYLTPERIINITRLSVALTFCWPVPSNSSRIKTVGFKLLQIINIISASLLLLPLFYSIYLHTDDIIVISKCLCIAAALSQFIIQTVVCLVNYDSIQYIVEEMVTYVKEALQYEREIFCKYITKCKIFYGSLMACVYVGSAAFILGPVVIDSAFPSEAEYPFRVDYAPVHVILYMHQSILSFQCAAHVCICMFGVLLLWYTTARFECLAMELQECTNVHMLVVCLNKQLRLKRYAEKVIDHFRYIVLFAIGVSTLALTECGIIMIVNVPPLVKLQFGIICMAVLTEVYVYAWPANSLMDMSIYVSRSAYDLIWYDKTLEMQKHLLVVLAYQKPIVFSVTCVMPELSLRYFCSYLSNAFSIFAALRVMIEDSSP